MNLARSLILSSCVLPTLVGFGAPQARPIEPPATAPSTQSSTVDADLSRQLDDIDRRAAEIHDLTAVFEQRKYTALLKKPLLSSGKIRVKGSVVLWDTDKPHESVMAMNESEIRIYYPRQAVVEVYPLEKRLGQLASSPLPRLAMVKQSFSIERMTWENLPSGASQADHMALRLTPLSDALREHVREVRVLINIKSACAVEVEMIDPDDERISLSFNNVRVNTGLEDRDVTLSVPPGVKESHPLDGLTGSSLPEPAPNDLNTLTTMPAKEAP